HRGPSLLLANGFELFQQAGRSSDFFEHAFAALARVDATIEFRQPLLSVLMDVAEKVAARVRHFGGEPPDGLHPLGLSEALLQHAKTRLVFDDDLDEIAHRAR